MVTAEQIISLLGLKPHPEGGYFRETYRSDETLPGGFLPERYGDERSFSTAIYYLLAPGTFSSMHRLKTDEVFHFYAGDPVEMLHLYPDGSGKVVILGPDIMNGMHPQVIVPRGVWQGARMLEGGKFALLGTTVAPGFEHADYKAGERGFLLDSYPQFRDRIIGLTP